jgi:ribosomal protein L11 methyltransferase
MSHWRELVFLVPADEVERWSDALLEEGALSVQAEDADADSADEQALYGEPGMPVERAGWQRTRLAALLSEDEKDPADLLARSAALLEPPSAALPAFEIRLLADRDWVRASQDQFVPIDVGQRLRITPTWHAQAGEHAGVSADGRLTLILDPGLAFGTGSHPTTQLCLSWLEQNLPAGASVIDYGCGSGILAIAAARLGAGSVIGVDIDPQAVRSAAENARVNGVHLQALCTTDPAPAPADVVVANILANPLKVLAPMLTALVRPGGSLILAGLLDRQVEEILAVYPDVALGAFDSQDGWTCLAGRKR